MEVKDQINNFKSMVNSYKLTDLIITANNLGIFNCLSENEKSLEQISEELKITDKRIEPILNGLVYYEIICKNEKGYFLEKYKDILFRNSKYNQTGYIDFAKEVMTKYSNLENAIKDNHFAFKNFKDLTEQQAESFMKGMSANAIPQAQYIAKNYNFENHTILDVGAGAGTYLITVAKEYTTVKGKMIDLPEVSKIQSRNIANENLQDRLISISCDYNVGIPNEQYDDIFLFAVIHQELQNNVKKLFDNIYNALKPNGRLFLTSFFLNEDKISPEFSVQFAIEMLVNSKDGKVYTHNEITNLLKESKFIDIERIDEIPSPATLYVSRKRNVNEI